MEIDQIRAELAALLEDESLFDETRLQARDEAIEFIQYVGEVLKVPGYAGVFDPFYPQALDLQEELQKANQTLFQQVRAKLKNRDFTPESLQTYFKKFSGYVPGKSNQNEYEYDSLDLLLEGVIFEGARPGESVQRAPDMIRYEATPGRVILKMVDRLRFTADDIFIDIGSGLGLVVMMVNLLTGVRSVGIEYDPAYCAYARKCATGLKLQNVSFIQSDACDADLNQGNIFYLFTPFVNTVFKRVLARLRFTAIRKPIYICSYGTITYDLIKLPWLQIRDPAMEHDFKLAIFSSK
jgi:hypothetical protein